MSTRNDKSKLSIFHAGTENKPYIIVYNTESGPTTVKPIEHTKEDKPLETDQEYSRRRMDQLFKPKRSDKGEPEVPYCDSCGCELRGHGNAMGDARDLKSMPKAKDFWKY